MGRVLGLATVSEQIAGLSPKLGRPAAGINGDFYTRQGAFTGDPRGLQILEGELISAASPRDVTLWVDLAGEPHIGAVESGLSVKAADGTTAMVGLNEERRTDQLVLFTPALGTSTRSRGGRELVLEHAGDGAWLPLNAGKSYHARIAQVRPTGNTVLSNQTMVLSVGPAVAAKYAQWSAGTELDITTATTPSLLGVKTAISGGPALVHAGKVQRIRMPDDDTYQSRSAYERHPRSAVGWNDTTFFLVEVDGRQMSSVGMTLQELGTYLVKLGCTEGMNLDGGGSATLWYAGHVRNRPCDGQERPVANALVVVQKPAAAAAGDSGAEAGAADSKEAGSADPGGSPTAGQGR
jgi:hypothetical protein